MFEFDPRTRAQATFSSLAVRNFRLFLGGQLLSLIGTWMQSVAQMWLVLHLTSSAIALGITAALQFAPLLLLAPWGGLVADRVDKRNLLLGTQAALATLAAMLAVLTLTGAVRLWMVWSLALLLGCVNAFDNPTRQSFVSEMVGRERIANAVLLNSAMFTGARVIGPAVAGVLIAAVGTGWCFAVNAISFLPVLWALAAMRRDELYRGRPLARGRGQIKEGIRYAWAEPEIRVTLLLMAVVGAFTFNFNMILPLMARFAFHSGAETYGALLSTMGAGSVVGALAAAGRAQPGIRLVGGSAALFGALTVGAALAPSFPWEVATLLPLGAAMVTYQAMSNSLVQTRSDPSFRGRVLALYVMVFLGTTPIGAPIIGWVAQARGPRVALAAGGLIAAAGGLLVLVTRAGIRPSRRPQLAGGTGGASPV